MSARLLLGVVLALVITSCASVPSKLATLRSCPASTPVVSMKVPYPILLLHGLGQKADVWHGAATSYFTKDLGLSYGGELTVNERDEIAVARPDGGDADFYTVAFSDPHDSVNAWRDELERAISYVRRVTGADRVILVGYSMGGLAARAYLTKRLTDHHVKRLVTIGTPHLGSPFARVWNWKTEIEQCVRTANVVLAQPCKAALAAIQGTEGDVPYNAPAVRDLRRPDDGGEYLRRLGKFAHPLDVEYVSVVGEVDLLDEVKNLREGAVQKLLRKVLSAVGGSAGDLFATGDGVVSAKSQDIMNIEFFTVDRSRRRTARVVNVGSVHVDHLMRNSDVQRVVLDDKAEFKGASICLVEGTPTLLVDVADPIPAHCSVTARIPEVSSVHNAPRGSAHLVRTADGIVARFLVPLTGVPLDTDQPYTVSISITNTFGYVTTASTAW